MMEPEQGEKCKQRFLPFRCQLIAGSAEPFGGMQSNPQVPAGFNKLQGLSPVQQRCSGANIPWLPENDYVRFI
jgi:hypothetical protein